MAGITDADFKEAKSFGKVFAKQTFGGFDDLYVVIDMLLLAKSGLRYMNLMLLTFSQD